MVRQPVLEIAALDGEPEMDLRIDAHDNGIEIIEVHMDDVMVDIVDEQVPHAQEEVVPDGIEYVDLLPADAEAVFEFMNVFDDLPQDVDGEFRKYAIT